jgi:hypothetical protein
MIIWNKSVANYSKPERMFACGHACINRMCGVISKVGKQAEKKSCNHSSINRSLVSQTCIDPKIFFQKVATKEMLAT